MGYFNGSTNVSEFAAALGFGIFLVLAGVSILINVVRKNRY